MNTSMACVFVCVFVTIYYLSNKCVCIHVCVRVRFSLRHSKGKGVDPQHMTKVINVSVYKQ